MIFSEVKGIVQFINFERENCYNDSRSVYVMSFFDYMLYLLAFDDSLERLRL